MPPRSDRSDEWKIAEFDRRTVEGLDEAHKRLKALEIWAEGIKIKVAFFATLFGVGGTVATEILVHYLKLK